jgi:hypothetical protein
MSAATAERSAPKVKVTIGTHPITQHTGWESETSVQARVGRRSLRPEIKRTTAGDFSVPRYSEGVSVHLAEWDQQRSAVYLEICSHHRAADGTEFDGAFEEVITEKQLDDLIELLVATREKARELGILTPLAVPKAKSA